MAGYIYIMTNPCLQNMVKIGYATDVEQRRKQLSTTALPYDYEVYATYETTGKLEDKKLHKLIDSLNPDLRVTKTREFFVMSPEEAYELLEAIAMISGSQDKLKRTKKVNQSSTQKPKNPPINFSKCGIPVGAELVYIHDDNVKAIVESDRKVIYNNEITSLSAIVANIKGVKAIQGPAFFTYNGKLITEIAEATQWKV
ncbi:MAG: GIY-YIG nuclease family protein [Acutalibacteraceae bacterium]|nr:GIY-YIG nuclease family protein [Acutalibacteraceae bacterium]